MSTPHIVDIATALRMKYIVSPKPRSWYAEPRDTFLIEHLLPPDVTGPGEAIHGCSQQSSDVGWPGYECTRNLGHTGRHAAGTGLRVIAVWP